MRPLIPVFNLIAFILPSLLLAGCGTKGPLTLPPGPDKPPLFGRPAPTATAAVLPSSVTPSLKPETARDDSNKPAGPATRP